MSLWVASTRSPLARKRSDAHVWQRRRTIGRQVGATTQFSGIAKCRRRDWKQGRQPYTTVRHRKR